MIFKPFLIRKVLDGDKTVTRRPSPSQYQGKEGKYVKIQPGMARESMAYIFIVSVRTEPLGAITDAEAVLEGFEDRADFLGYWSQLYGGRDPDLSMMVDRIEFERQEAWLDLCPKCGGCGTVNHPETYEGIAFPRGVS